MTRRGLKITAVILAVVAMLSLSFSVFQLSASQKYSAAVTSSYTRAFYELAENTEKIYYSLCKASLASDSYQLMKLSSQIKESAAFALSDIAQLPVSSLALENLSTFLNQSGDYTYTVALRHLDQSATDASERENFLTLASYAEKLKNAIYNIRERVASGELSFEKASDEELSSFGQSLHSIETSAFSDYQQLSYNGPFSEHMNTLNSVMLNNLPTISPDEAFTFAMNVLYNNVGLTFQGVTEGKINTYVFMGDTPNAHYSVEISKNGGKCVSITCNKVFNDPQTDIADALFKGKKYLEYLGFNDMVETYYENSGTVVTINYASVQKGIKAYPDLITVQVALDTGEIVGLDTEGYLMNYHKRSVPEKLISDELLSQKTAEGFAVEAVSLAVIPTEYGGEHLCYELKGQYFDKTFLIYVNAENGIEEEILLLTEDEYRRLVN